MDQFGTGPSASVHMYITSNFGRNNGSGGIPDETVLPIRARSAGSDWDFEPRRFPTYDHGIDGYSDGTTHLRSFYPPFFNPYYKWFGTQTLWLNGNIDEDIQDWTAVSPTTPPLSSDPEPEIFGGQDVITAIGEAATNHAHVYLGYYSGKTFWSTAPCTTPMMDCATA